MSEAGGHSPALYDLFLSHSSADKPWVRTLCDALQAAGLAVFLDEQELAAPRNFVGQLSDALRASRFLVLVASPRAALSAWVQQEWTAFLAEHGPRDRIVVVLREAVDIPPLLKTVQQIDATGRDVARVAAEVVRAVGLVGQLSPEDARALTLGQDLVFVLARAADGQLEIVDPAGVRRTVAAPWQTDTAFTVARLGFQKLAHELVTSDAERAELHRHARTLGGQLFDLLFGDPASRRWLDAAQIVGRPRPLVTLRSDDDVLLSLPWELLHDGQRFLLRDQAVDLARSKLGRVAPQALLHEPSGYFKLVVNVSAPAGGGLSYEEESYRITRALSETCLLIPTELGTLVDLVDTVARETPTGIHFSGHGEPGKLQFEDDEGESHVVPIRTLLSEMRAKATDGGLPKFFYLASCHGNEPAAPDKDQAGSESSAAAVQRAGIPQVVGYYGPILDELSTRAEEALYGAIAAGLSTRYAVRQARRALADPIFAVGTHPFAWAQLVFYHHGPDHPLSRPVPAVQRRQLDATLQRTFTGAGDRKILATGFIGRRSELHRVRKRLRRGDKVLVFQGLGGLGKTTLAFQTLSLITPDDNDVCVFWCHEAEQAADPAETLVGQLLNYCRRRFGFDLEGVVQQVDRVAGDDATQRFGYYLQTLLANVERLAIYLDNLESLLVAPRDGDATRDKAVRDEEAAVDAESFASWRSESLRKIWQMLDTLARESGKLHVVASCRYVNDDFRRQRISVSPLPADAMFRLLAWFPGLRRLAAETRAALVARLDGHPRAAEYANDLLENSLANYEDRYGTWQLPETPQAADLAREWTTLVESALPKVHERLQDNLLLAAIWQQVLDDRARRMLSRMTLLRRPWEWGLVQVLGEPNEDAKTAEATAERLLRTSLLERMEVLRNVAGGQRLLVHEYTLHPATAELVTDREDVGGEQRQATHRRIGDWLAAKSARRRILEDYLDAGYHLYEAGEYELSCDFLGRSSDFLRHRGHATEAWGVLRPFLTPPILVALPREKVRLLYRTAGLALTDLGQIATAIKYHKEALKIAIELGDRVGEGRDHGCLGHSLLQLGQAEESAKHCEKGLEIIRSSGDRLEESNIMRTLGNATFFLRDVDQARLLIHKSLEISRSLDPPDRSGEAASLSLLGNIVHHIGRYHEAIKYYQSALEIDVEFGDRRGEEADRGGLGLAYLGLDEDEKAINCFYKSLEIARSIHDPLGEATALTNLGNAYAKLHLFDKAKEYWRAAIRIGQEIKDSRIVQIASRQLEKHGG